MSEKKESPKGDEPQVPAQTNEAVPDHIKQTGPARGSENITVKDIALPRIQIAQSMSPAMKSSDAAYIAGIVEGDIYNTLTRENYGQSVMVVPVFFSSRYVCWRSRETGGGFRGSFNTEAEANEREALGAAQGEKIETVATAEYLVLVIAEDGSTEQALISMGKTQLKKSRQWNSLMLGTKRDSFATTYRLTTVTESNTRGAYKNWNASPAGFTPKAAYTEAEILYKQVKEGNINIVAADEATGSSDY